MEPYRWYGSFVEIGSKFVQSDDTFEKPGSLLNQTYLIINTLPDL